MQTNTVETVNMVPPAQVTYLLSAQYKNVGLNQVSSSLVLGGAVSFPLIYVSMSFLSMRPDDMFLPLLISGEPG